MYPFHPLDFGLSDTQQQIQSAVEDFAQSTIAPLAEEIDSRNQMPRHLWQEMGALGILGITVNEQYGGANCDYLTHVLVMEAISRASAAVGLSYGAHSNLCVNQIHRYGSETQKQQYLPALCQGNAIGALAMSEPQAGSDVMAMQLLATEVEHGFSLSGNKMWITNGPCADVLIVYARTSSNSISAFLIEKGVEGFSTAQKLDKLGMRGSDTCELVFDNCVIPQSQLLGERDKGEQVLMSGLDLERLVLAGGPLGIMSACMTLAATYASERKQFGRRIGDYQLIQAKLADMYSRMMAARCYVYTVARNYDKQVTAKQDTAACLLFAAEHATQMALDTIQVLGGNGYINDYAAGRLLRDAKLYEIGAGTSEIRRLIIGRALVNHYAH
ncbi:acyl-CoA dehydrogenase family protein [Thaumasiovibrio subtropicus]|uniref:acyl-CoA dehydrogenase family protein n=1 Tax=Thaumasiovibrio subtropicus TaxID=1891207 RepID=UPI000B3573B0|nr:acyl-CoA dehydrogenase family protein [Thaumasiovibrio subtropicus]